MKKMAFALYPFLPAMGLVSLMMTVSTILGISLPWVFVGTMPSAIFAIWFICHEKMRADIVDHIREDTIIYVYGQYRWEKVFVVVPKAKTFFQKAYHSSIAIMTLIKICAIPFTPSSESGDGYPVYQLLFFDWQSASLKLFVIFGEDDEPFSKILNEVDQKWMEFVKGVIR